LTYAPTCSACTPSLHDALPIFGSGGRRSRTAEDSLSIRPIGPAPERVVERARPAEIAGGPPRPRGQCRGWGDALGNTRPGDGGRDRKSTRLNSSHSQISYVVFC